MHSQQCNEGHVLELLELKVRIENEKSKILCNRGHLLNWSMCGADGCGWVNHNKGLKWEWLCFTCEDGCCPECYEEALNKKKAAPPKISSETCGNCMKKILDIWAWNCSECKWNLCLNCRPYEV